MTLAACGGGGTGDGAEGSASPAQVRECLTADGFRVVGGPRSPDDTDAPDLELIASTRGQMAFIAFYNDPDRAQRYEPKIRKNAKKFAGVVERHGRVSVIWTAPPGALSKRVADCL